MKSIKYQCRCCGAENKQVFKHGKKWNTEHDYMINLRCKRCGKLNHITITFDIKVKECCEPKTKHLTGLKPVGGNTI